MLGLAHSLTPVQMLCPHEYMRVFARSRSRLTRNILSVRSGSYSARDHCPEREWPQAEALAWRARARGAIAASSSGAATRWW